MAVGGGLWTAGGGVPTDHATPHAIANGPHRKVPAAATAAERGVAAAAAVVSVRMVVVGCG